VNTLFVLEEWRGEQRISPPRDNFTPRGQTSPLGDNFAPGGEVKNGPQLFQRLPGLGLGANLRRVFKDLPRRQLHA
jgi:hypothetical protein